MESAAEEAIATGVVVVRFLLDSDICSAYLKGHQKVASQCLLHHGSLCVSAITIGELRTWTSRSKASEKAKRALDLLMMDVQIFSVDLVIAERFGLERAKLFDHGTPVGEMDLLIATTALVHDLTLVTHNLSDFREFLACELSIGLINKHYSLSTAT